MARDDDKSERLLRLLSDLADETKRLREEMHSFRSSLRELTEKLSGASAGASLLGLLGKGLRR